MLDRDLFLLFYRYPSRMVTVAYPVEEERRLESAQGGY